MMKACLGAAAMLSAVLAVGPAMAEPGLANKVYSPYVKKGVTELELRGGRIDGKSLDGESGAVFELEQGITDRVSLAVAGELEHHAGEETKLDAIAVEGVAYLGQIPRLGVDVGGYLEYEQRIHNESGVLEGKLLLAKQFGRVQTLVNLIASRPLTDKQEDQETEYGYAVQTTYDTGKGVALGVQAFGDLGTSRSFGGRQAHYLGPVALWEVRPAWFKGGEIEFEAAYLIPAGTAHHESDGQVRFGLEFEKRF
jgi:hypothetical protein